MTNKFYFSLLIKNLVFISICCILFSCTTTKNVNTVNLEDKPPQLPIRYIKEFGERPSLQPDSSIFELTAKQKSDFLAYLDRPIKKDQDKHKLVGEYLAKFVKGFNYHSDTFNASEAASKYEGNCMSLAILTTAFANIAGVEIGYELMHSAPIYQKKGNTIIASQHIRSILYDPNYAPEPGVYYFFEPVIKIDYFPTSGGIVKRRVREPEFVSMYYKNKAAEAIIENRLVNAFWLVEHSLQLVENDAQATNLLALIYDKLGYDEYAEDLYQFGIKHATEKLELYSNYKQYLVRKNRLAEADIINQEILKIDEPNPFDWLSLGDEAFNSGKLSDANRFYEKVIDIAPYLHQGYFGRGRVAFERGLTKKAKRAFDKANELAHESEEKQMYRAKLEALSVYSKN